jgi:hypothetical protein
MSVGEKRIACYSGSRRAGVNAAGNFHLHIPHTKLRDAIWEYGRFEVYDFISTNSLNVTNATDRSILHVYSDIFPLRNANREKPGCGEIRSLLSVYQLQKWSSVPRTYIRATAYFRCN